jgi:hypothetical protein
MARPARSGTRVRSSSARISSTLAALLVRLRRHHRF